MIEMAKLRIRPARSRVPSVLKTERHPPVPDLGNLSGAAVDQPETGVVAGPADAVADA